ncbi:MAG: exonuclease SbcCD subunit D [Acidimicrobiales bacterium]
MRPVRLLHTSDVHLGGGFLAPESGRHHRWCLCPLHALERAAYDVGPDVVLVAGDLFDHQRVSADFVDEVMGRLAALPGRCVVTSGNHDLHDGRSLYRDWLDHPDLVVLDRPDGVTVELMDGAMMLWGKAMDDHHRGFRPLDGVPARPRADAWWVVMGHGHYEPTVPEGGFDRSSPLTPDEIVGTGADYVALGHWHRRTEVSAAEVVAWYSGAPHGPGASGSFNRIDLRPGVGVTVEPVAVVLPAAGCLDGPDPA